MELAPLTRKTAAVVLKAVESGTTRRGLTMPVAQRRQECGRLLTYYETLTNSMAKAKALNRVREIFEKLKSEKCSNTYRTQQTWEK